MPCARRANSVPDSRGVIPRLHTKKGLDCSRFPARVFTNEGPQHQWRGLRDKNPRHSTAQRCSAVARRPSEKSARLDGGAQISKWGS
jgi:hypothetical protein